MVAPAYTSIPVGRTEPTPFGAVLFSLGYTFNSDTNTTTINHVVNVDGVDTTTSPGSVYCRLASPIPADLINSGLTVGKFDVFAWTTIDGRTYATEVIGAGASFSSGALSFGGVSILDLGFR